MAAIDSIYHRAPYPLRVAGASARGIVLRRRRYSRHTETLVDQALSRENWTAGEWGAWQDDRLGALLRSVQGKVPAYREFALASGSSAEALAAFPLLHKERLRLDPRSFVRVDAANHLVTENTSGTSGTPLKLWISRTEYQDWYALCEARWRRWYGVTRHDRWAIVGGQPVVPPKATRPPYWVWNAALSQLYLSSYHVASHTAADYVRAMDHHRVTYLLGYPSSIHALAQACLELEIRPKPLRVVIGNAEPVLDHQRSVIEDVFGCPVRETYGMAEFVAAASECEHRRLHLWPEVGVLEVLEQGSDRPVSQGYLGRFVCTGLLNQTMPLVRYLVGDYGSLSAGADCACGRHLPILERVEGRSDDLVRTADGRLIGRLDPIFKGSHPIKAAQVIQEDFDFFRLVLVPAAGFDLSSTESIVQRLRDRVGEVRVEVELVEDLPVGPNGKFKAVVSKVT